MVGGLTMETDMNEINVTNSITIPIPKDFTNDIARWGTKCLVCGGEVPIYSPSDHGYKICGECKRAILKMRECMKED